MHFLCTHSFLFLQDGSNAFHLCAAGGNVAIAQFLAPMMEDHLFNVDNDGYTALHWASQEGQLSMVEYLVKTCGFDLKAKDKVGLLRFASWLSDQLSISQTLWMDVACMNNVIVVLCFVSVQFIQKSQCYSLVSEFENKEALCTINFC